jgi:hypothetical protein
MRPTHLEPEIRSIRGNGEAIISKKSDTEIDILTTDAFDEG